MTITSLVPHGEVRETPSATYGIGKTLFRIGNGGAGATGLLKALADDFLAGYPDASIDWVCNHSRNTHVALHRGYVDIALTYERRPEHVAEHEGWSTPAVCVFHDHFVLAGPSSDPADVRSAPTIYDALRNIYYCKALFHSRQDGSATMVKENSLWNDAGLKPPVTDLVSNVWYRTSSSTPEQALINAAAAGAYLLTDRSTLLRQVWMQSIPNRSVSVFFEPTSADDVLMNSCFASTAVIPHPLYAGGTQAFLDYLTSPRGQDIIANYGIKETGFPLLSPVKEGFATTFLERGRPLNGRWVFPNKL